MLRSGLIALLLLTGSVHAHAADAEAPDPEARQAALQAGYEAYETGLDAAQSGDYDTAIREFRRAAGDGLDVAQYNLGILYYTGRGVEQDNAAALRWLKQAAEQGHTAAQFNVGVLYFNGQGTGPAWQQIWPVSLWSRSRDRAEAAQWYERAASAGHADAQYYLATMYQEGLGVDRDPVQAHFWAQAARDSEHREADVLLRILEENMSAEQVGRARRLYAEQRLAE